MPGRHVLPHFLEIDGQRIGRMGDAQPGIEAGHDGALRAGFPPELLRLSFIGGDVIIDQALGKCGVAFLKMVTFLVNGGDMLEMQRG